MHLYLQFIIIRQYYKLIKLDNFGIIVNLSFLKSMMFQSAFKHKVKLLRNQASLPQRHDKQQSREDKKKKKSRQSESNSFEKKSQIKVSKFQNKQEIDSKRNDQHVNKKKKSKLLYDVIENAKNQNQSPHEYYFRLTHQKKSNSKKNQVNSKSHNSKSSSHKKNKIHKENHKMQQKTEKHQKLSCRSSIIKSAGREKKSYSNFHKKSYSASKIKPKKIGGKLKIKRKSNLESCIITKNDSYKQFAKKYFGVKSSKEKFVLDLKKINLEIYEEADYIRHYFEEQDFLNERSKNISMLGKIASSMSLKRQTYSQAIAFLDRFLDHNSQKKCIKVASIAALIMALKFEHAESVGSLVHQLTFVEETPNSFYRKTREQKRRIKNETKIYDEEHREVFDNPESLKTSSTNPKFNLNRPKLPNILTVVLSHQQIFSEYDRIICKQDISDMEMQMIVKFNFSLNIRSMYHWIVIIFKIWSEFTFGGNENSITKGHKKKRQILISKIEQIYTTLIHICQWCEISNVSMQFSKPIIVLSVLYLLVRIYWEFNEVQKGLEHYRVNLFKSTNILFSDKKGINQYFGTFLEIVDLDMGNIVHCCQQASKFFVHKIIKPLLDEEVNKSATKIDTYFYYSQMHRIFQTKISQ